MDNNSDELHKIILNIYKSFQKICTEHKLRYFAISGTTLGAVLWKRIIPWDDDMDIAMPAEDYKKFINVCKSSLPKHLVFSEYLWFGGKLHDDRTTFTSINYIHNPSRYNGIFIDIVPLVALPDKKEERIHFIENLKTFQKFGLLYDRYNDTEYGEKKLAQWKNQILTTHKFGSTAYVMDFSDPRYILSSKGFNHPVNMQFKDTFIPVSSNYQEDLTTQYGDFKKYPDKKSRQSIHGQQSILNLHSSYKNLAKEFDALPQWTKDMFIKKNQNEGLYLKSLYYTQGLLKNSNKELERVNLELKKIKAHPFNTFFSSIKKRIQN